MDALVEIRDMCKIYNPGENEVKARPCESDDLREGVRGDYRAFRFRQIHADEYVRMSGCSDKRKLLSAWT